MRNRYEDKRLLYSAISNSAIFNSNLDDDFYEVNLGFNVGKDLVKFR